MVIVVFGDEVRQVDEAHRRTQPRMPRGAFEVATAIHQRAQITPRIP
jgi:hypothetical protein